MTVDQRRRAGLAVALVAAAQLVFWSSYAALPALFAPAGAARMLDPAGGRLVREPLHGEPAAAFVAGLGGPARLTLPGWQPAVATPSRPVLLAPDAGTGPAAARPAVTCLVRDCRPGGDVFLAGWRRAQDAARWERLVRSDVPRVTVVAGIVLGLALLLLLPVSRFSRVQGMTGVFLVLVGLDAQFTAFGARDFPTAWFPVLRYAVEYALLAAAALVINAFTGWRGRDARIAVAISVAMFGGMVVAWHAGRLDALVPWFDATVVALLAVYITWTIRALWRRAPGPALRALAILLVGITSLIHDIAMHLHPAGIALEATALSPLFVMLGIVLELATQGYRLTQEADEARSDLERQLLEQDANLLRSSSLLRHHERLLAVDAERQRMMRDMHDGVGGTLTHLLLDVRGDRLAMADVERGLQAAVDDLRNMAGAVDGGDQPLDLALAAFCERMAPRVRRSGAAFDYHCALPMPAPALRTGQLLNLYRLLQEGITNSLRHAAPTRIRVRAETGVDDTIRIVLADDGCGFDPAAARALPGEGRGLANIRRRAAHIGAALTIDAAPGQGTRLVIAIPVPARDGRIR